MVNMNVALLRSGTRPGIPLSSMLFNIVLRILDNALRKDKVKLSKLEKQK